MSQYKTEVEVAGNTYCVTVTVTGSKVFRQTIRVDSITGGVRTDDEDYGGKGSNPELMRGNAAWIAEEIIRRHLAREKKRLKSVGK